jgi:hypothetical protein
MKNFKGVLTVILICLAVFLVFSYIVALKEKNELTRGIERAREQVNLLLKDKLNLMETIKEQQLTQQNLTQENNGLKETLRVNTEKLAQVDAELAQAKKNMEQLNAEAAVLRSENAQMKERLGSIKELKKAIKEIKIQMHNAKVEVLKKVDMQRLLEGNRGFMVKEGKSTYQTKIKIEVNPAR